MACCSDAERRGSGPACPPVGPTRLVLADEVEVTSHPFVRLRQDAQPNVPGELATSITTGRPARGSVSRVERGAGRSISATLARRARYVRPGWRAKNRLSPSVTRSMAAWCLATRRRAARDGRQFMKT